MQEVNPFVIMTGEAFSLKREGWWIGHAALLLPYLLKPLRGIGGKCWASRRQDLGKSNTTETTKSYHKAPQNLPSRLAIAVILRRISPKHLTHAFFNWHTSHLRCSMHVISLIETWRPAWSTHNHSRHVPLSPLPSKWKCLVPRQLQA